MTADTRRTRGSSAEVSTSHCPQARGREGPGGRGVLSPEGEMLKGPEKEASSHEASVSSRCEEEVLSLPPAAAMILVLSSH